MERARFGRDLDDEPPEVAANRIARHLKRRAVPDDPRIVVVIERTRQSLFGLLPLADGHQPEPELRAGARVRLEGGCMP